MHHCKDAVDALVDYVDKFRIDCVLCQDPYIFYSKISGIPNHWISFVSKNNSAILFTNRDYVVITP